MRTWIGTILEKGILTTHGIKKGTEYLLNPELFAHAKTEYNTIVKDIRTIQV